MDTAHLGTVFKISAAGSESILHSFTGVSPNGGVNDGSNPLAGLIMDSAGSLYGTTQFGGGNDQGTVFEITAAGNETVLYSFPGSANDGVYPEAGLIMDSAGNLYGTTYAGGKFNLLGQVSYGTVFEISVAGTESILYSFAGLGLGTTDGQNPRAGLIMDSAGNFYGTTQLGGPNDDGIVFKIN
jgi:uncharacterized repeat protein (TIGR03803 family)